ncbi:MAG: diguanylate cyclase [Rhodospirillales bacterium]
MRLSPLTILIVALALLFAALPWGSEAAKPDGESLRKVRIHLKWSHQFQFAGYYAAIQQGYFTRAGLEVELIEGSPVETPVQTVTSGRAEFGIGNGSLIVARAEGAPVVAVAPVLQNTPFLIIARRDSAIRDVHDLEGRRLMVESQAHELLAYLTLEGVDLDKVEIVPHTGKPLDLATGYTDAMTAYVTTEPFELITNGIAYQEFLPRLAGINMYGDTLFTSEKLAKEDPALVIAVRDAVIKGWHYALDHPNDMIDLILGTYKPTLNPRLLEFEAETLRNLMAMDLVSIGYMNKERWHHIAEVFRKAGMVPQSFTLEGFLFDPDPALQDLTAVYATILILAVTILVVSGTAYRFHLLNRSLEREINRRQALELELRSLATTDPLSGLANRRHFLERAEEAVHTARRQGLDLALIYLDLDNFKQINDCYGHPAGDAMIRHIALIGGETLSEDDLMGRIGGEEFAILLAGKGQTQALSLAEHIRARLETGLLTTEAGATFSTTASFGMTCLNQDDRSIDDLIRRADAALYRAKREGRNRVEEG